MEDKIKFCDFIRDVLNKSNLCEGKNREPLDIIEDNNLEEAVMALCEMLADDKLSYDNIEYLGSGLSNLVLKITSKNDKTYVVKLGITKQEYDIPYSSYMIQPLLRDRVPLKDGQFFTVEVQNEAKVRDKLGYPYASGRDVGEIVSGLNEEGIKWKDPGTMQVGMLDEEDENRRVIPEGAGGYTDNGGLDGKKPKRHKFVIIDLEGIKRKEDNKRNSGPDR